jgi:hypothetical protein
MAINEPEASVEGTELFTQPVYPIVKSASW